MTRTGIAVDFQVGHENLAKEARGPRNISRKTPSELEQEGWAEGK